MQILQHTSTLSSLLLALLAGLLLPSVSQGGGYTGPGEILKFSNILGDGTFELIGNFSDPDNCAGGNPPEKFIVGAHSSDTDMARNSKFSTILSAYHSGQTIELFVDGCSGVHPIMKFIYTPSR